MLPYGRQSVSDSDIEAVVEVLRGDWLTTGPAVAALEAALSTWAGGRRAVTATSGTAALHMAYAAAGVGPGDRVVTTPMTFVATASTASMLGADVVFADIDAATGLISPKAVEELIDDRTAVVSAVDYAGRPADYGALAALAGRVGARVLADAAHSFGGFVNGNPVGTLADITALSFFPTKNLTTGEGGAVIFAEAAEAQRAHEFHFIGLVRDPERFRIGGEGPWHQEVHEWGLNYRLSDIASALGLSQLRRLEAFRRRRQQITDLYNEAFSDLGGLVTPPAAPEGTEAAWHLYSVQVLDGRRRELYERMRAAGVGVQVNYMPVYWHPVYADLGYPRGLCPQAELYYSRQLSLPLFPDLTDDDVGSVIDTVRSVLA